MRWERLATAGAVAGGTAAVLAACTIAPSGSAALPGSGRPATSPAPLRGRPAAPACTPPMLRIRAGREGDGPGAHGDVEFTDVGTRACTMRGLPVVTVATATGKPLPITPEREPGVALRPVVLTPGRADAADLVISWSNWCDGTPGPLEVRVLLPGGRTVTGPFDGPPDYDFVPRCLDPQQGSAIWVVAAYL
jgi:hypothetical protein